MMPSTRYLLSGGVSWRNDLAMDNSMPVHFKNQALPMRMRFAHLIRQASLTSSLNFCPIRLAGFLMWDVVPAHSLDISHILVSQLMRLIFLQQWSVADSS